jgi:alpha-galactosidase
MWFNEASANQEGVNGSVIPSKPGDAAFGPLTTGFGCNSDPNLFGPELGFGFGMNEALGGTEPFLIMKLGWGGKSLAGDFRPPTSVKNFDPYCQGDCPNVVGHFYQVLVADVHAMLAPGAIAKMFPDLAGLTPKLTGLGWYHG